MEEWGKVLLLWVFGQEFRVSILSLFFWIFQSVVLVTFVLWLCLHFEHWFISQHNISSVLLYLVNTLSLSVFVTSCFIFALCCLLCNL